MQNDGIFIVKRYRNDPVRFCKEILGVSEFDKWQEEALTALTNHRRIAIGSGHGVGKTAYIAWVVIWFISTRPSPQIVVTANTKQQLDAKTWREIGKWLDKSKVRHWFEKTATKLYLKEQPDTWFAANIPWSENKPEAFAGTHEDHVLVIMDEASAISDVIFETTEGAMTTPGAYWIVTGNRTRNTGRFNECFGRFKHRWSTFAVDSRDSIHADSKQLEEWIEDYGEDSDFVRVRIAGLAPIAESNQFISPDIVNACKRYTAEGFDQFPIVMGVDVARFGDDKNVLCVRQGRKVYDLIKWRGVDTMQTSSRVYEQIQEWSPEIVFVDGVGVGGGVVDRLRQLCHSNLIYDVNVGQKADDAKYFNKRAEVWGKMKAYLQAGADLPDDMELTDQLVGPEYGFSPKQQIILEKKDDMKKRGLESPDCADALALTFTKDILKRPKPKPVMRDYSMGVAGGWMQ